MISITCTAVHLTASHSITSFHLFGFERNSPLHPTWLILSLLLYRALLSRCNARPSHTPRTCTKKLQSACVNHHCSSLKMGRISISFSLFHLLSSVDFPVLPERRSLSWYFPVTSVVQYHFRAILEGIRKLSHPSTHRNYTISPTSWIFHVPPCVRMTSRRIVSPCYCGVEL